MNIRIPQCSLALSCLLSLLSQLLLPSPTYTIPDVAWLPKDANHFVLPQSVCHFLFRALKPPCCSTWLPWCDRDTQLFSYGIRVDREDPLGPASDGIKEIIQCWETGLKANLPSEVKRERAVGAGFSLERTRGESGCPDCVVVFLLTHFNKTKLSLSSQNIQIYPNRKEGIAGQSFSMWFWLTAPPPIQCWTKKN